MVGALISLICDEARRIWCYRWIGAAATAALLLLGGAFVLRMPPVYDAWGQIFVNKQTPVTAATDGVSLVGENYGSPYLVGKTLLNDRSLERLVQRINPKAASMSKVELAGAVAGLKAQIQLSDTGDGFFEFHVKDQDPVRAERIARLILGEFVSRNLGRNAAQLQQASQFIDTQVAAYERMLAESRSRLAEFQQTHPSLTATASQPDPAAALELASAQAAFQAAVAERPGATSGTAPADERISALQAKLDALRLQYTDQHPDVLAAKRQLEQAMADRAAAPVGASRSSSSVDAARSRLAAAQRRAAPRSLATVSPVVQSEWAELLKSDEVLRANYQQLVTKREAARMSQAAYGVDGSNKYQVTREPTTPQLPTGPNRNLYLAAVLVAAIVGGAGVAYLCAAVQGIFVSPRELENAFQLPVVGTVSWEPAWSTAPATRPGALASFGAAVARTLRISRSHSTISRIARPS